MTEREIVKGAERGVGAWLIVVGLLLVAFVAGVAVGQAHPGCADHGRTNPAIEPSPRLPAG